MKFQESKQILLDCDGVLANFDRAAYEACASMYTLKFKSYADYVKQYPNGEWNMPAVMGISEAAFWHAIDGDSYTKSLRFWGDMPAYPRARWFYKRLAELAPVIICTCASNGHGFWSGRSEWLSETLGVEPAKLNLAILRGTPKCSIATEGSVLIDDNDRNCDDWRRFDGAAVLFPRRWNARHETARELGASRVYDAALAEVEAALS